MYIFIHHCDLRIEDNTTLNRLWSEHIEVQPIFIFTNQQIIDNPYKSSNAIQFMIESLVDLEESYRTKGINLLYFLGDTTVVLEQLVKINIKNIKGISFNKDYSPFATEREQLVQDLCDRYNIKCVSLEDKLLNPITSILTNKDTPYMKFTPYYKKANIVPIRKPYNSEIIPLSLSIDSSTMTIKIEEINKYYKINPNLLLKGGRKEGLEQVNKIKKQTKYNNTRNFPSMETTRLSAYLKFGTISIREVYYKTVSLLGTDTELLKQYYWRDFYNMLLYYHPNLSEKVSMTKQKMNSIKWDNNKEKFDRWCTGTTGCKIVDAGMREMNTTGYMHNRVRMIVATFLIFYLKIDWRWGMNYFSRTLLDSDWSSNVGNWQWTAGTEKWSNDPYKVFSMESQTERFDPDLKYINKWITDSITPIIKDYKLARKEGIEMYKSIKLI